MSLYWRWCSKSKEDLRVYSFWVLVHYALNNEMLAHAPNSWTECLKQLPVNSIVKHVEEHDRLVSDAHVTVTHKLNEKLLDPVKTLCIISDLRYKK